MTANYSIAKNEHNKAPQEAFYSLSFNILQTTFAIHCLPFDQGYIP